MSDRTTPETDAAQHEGLLRGNPMPTQVVPAEFSRRLERERDEARIDAKKSKAYKRVLKETNLRQNERIRYLEGATNHASGTPLSVALRERDEARENLDDALQEVDLLTLYFESMKQKRDEALSQIVQAECRAERFCQERDEAREALNKILKNE